MLPDIFQHILPWQVRPALDTLSNAEMLDAERRVLVDGQPFRDFMHYHFQQQRIRRGMPIRTDGDRVCPVIIYGASSGA